MRATTVIAPLFALVLGLSSSRVAAQSPHHAPAGPSATQEDAANCYHAARHDELRLWEGRAPGATGDDPCRDIPFVRVFPAKASGKDAPAAILIIPGGGYDRLTDEKEQAPVAEYFSQHLGVTAFVLYYRLVQADGTYRYPVPMWDGQRALKLLRAHAKELGIDPGRVGVFGFSAGGHLASTLALHPSTDFGLPEHDAIDAVSGRPTLLGLGYPVISMEPKQYAASSSRAHLLHGYQGQELEHLQHFLSGQENVTPGTPPVFLFESKDDQRISPENSILFDQALRAAKVPVDFQLFEHGVHGAGLATGIAQEEHWPERFKQWLQEQHFLR